jgi:hypothetical protein
LDAAAAMPFELLSRNKNATRLVAFPQESLHGDEQSAPRLRAQAQSGPNQDDGPKALDETQSRDWRVYGSEETWKVQSGPSGKEARIDAVVQGDPVARCDS